VNTSRLRRWGALAVFLGVGCSTPPGLRSEVGLVPVGERAAALGVWLDPPDAPPSRPKRPPEILLWDAAPTAAGRVVQVETLGPRAWRVSWGYRDPEFVLDLDVEQVAWRDRVLLDVVHGELLDEGAPTAAPELLAELRERRQLGPLNDGPAGPGKLPRMLTIRLNPDGSYAHVSQGGVALDLLDAE